MMSRVEAVSPRLIVALGATAAQGLTGRAIRVQSNRGSIPTVDKGLRVLMTIHPPALLRSQDEEEKRSGYASFVNDRDQSKGCSIIPPMRQTQIFAPLSSVFATSSP